jgi:hypothetical protein
MPWVLLIPILVPLALGIYFLAMSGRPYPPRGRKFGGDLRNYDPPVELNISGREFPEGEPQKKLS